MALPKCGFCNNPFFATTVIEPVGSNFKLIAIHCNSCGAVFGVTEYYNVGGMLETLAKKLGVGQIS